MRRDHPKRMFRPFAKPLADFFQMAGLAMFDDWDSREISRIGQSIGRQGINAGSLVASQIIDALACGQIRASIRLDLEISSESEWQENTFFIGGRFFHLNSDRELDWSNSLVNIPRFYIFYQNDDGVLRGINSVDSEKKSDTVYSRVPISIENAYEAIAETYSIGDIPSEQWFRRYDSYKNRLFDELCIVAWRFLAITKPDRNSNVHTRIIELIRNYVESVGIDAETTRGLSDQALTNFATEILRQWHRENTLEFALINSSPERKYLGTNIKSNK